MRSHLFNLRIPHPIYEGSLRRENLFTYESLAQYWINLGRRDLIAQPDHELTKWYSMQSESVQDFMDDCLLVFPCLVPNDHAALTHHFCEGIIQVMITRHHCSRAKAILCLPPAVQALCASCGVC